MTRFHVRRQLGQLKRFLSRKVHALHEYLKERVGWATPVTRHRPVRVFPKHLAILPVEAIPGPLLHHVKRQVEQTFGEFFYDVTILDTHVPRRRFHRRGVKERRDLRSLKRFKLYPARSFYDLGRQKLAGREIQPWNVVVLVVTKRHVYSNTPKAFNFLFGEANRVLDISIVSLFPLTEEFYERARDDGLLRARVAKEVIHELGHLLIHSLEHCDDARCVMAHAASIEEVDQKRANFCPRCQARLEQVKAQFNI